MTRPSCVVTGIGLVTPVGENLGEVFDALCHGPSGLRRPPEGHAAAGSLEVAGVGPAIDPASVVPATEARVLDRYIVMAIRAADRAIRAAEEETGLPAADPVREGRDGADRLGAAVLR